MKYYIITYGCQMNVSDSERIESFLKKQGQEKASNIEEADLIVVNMCSVRQSAVNRVLAFEKKFLKLKEKKPNLKTILTGCFLEKDRKKFEKIFDSVVRINDFFALDKEEIAYFKIEPSLKEPFIGLVPISRGCRFQCAYCVVPFTRGPLICRSFQEIINEVKTMVQNGAKEIWLLGQNVNDYRWNIYDFSDLISEIEKIEGSFWLRINSPHPMNFTDKIINTLAKSKKFTPYLNLPLQSGDDFVLRQMRRNYTVAEYKKIVKKIKTAFKKYRQGIEKNIALSTDIIVGFPGEKRKHFENTKKIVQEIKFDNVYLAKFSPRPQTMAEKMKEQVPEDEKEKRYQELKTTIEKISFEKNLKFLGKSVKVLVEKEKNGFLFGKTRHFKTVKFKGPKTLIGNFTKVKINGVKNFGLLGQIK